MLIRVYSPEYGKYVWQKAFLSIWICTFRIWLLEAVIMQAKVRLSHKKL